MMHLLFTMVHVPQIVQALKVVMVKPIAMNAKLHAMELGQSNKQNLDIASDSSTKQPMRHSKEILRNQNTLFFRFNDVSHG